ncbi:PD-(D/E)XK nuclease family protein [Candidatus Woesearchaeota archaeon]|nr:PD-(D/E)XK nuclease family protein [Candidatus Woesearchaeota archaeon]
MISIIKQRILDHKGGVYVYRVHTHKLESLGNPISHNLKKYLYSVFDSCPDEHFNNGNLRSSGLKFKVNLNTESTTGHEINTLSKYGLVVNNDRYKNNHSKVQVFMLEHDNKTIATEVPIWASKDEVSQHMPLFTNHDFITGHIDLLRIEDGKIWVWDYKPNAQREEYATTQVYFYALMLSKRTGIDLSRFMCGYFDSSFTYIFNPAAKNISIANYLL